MTSAAIWLRSTRWWKCTQENYLTAPAKEIGKIRSVLTMVGGKVVYASGPYEALSVGAGSWFRHSGAT
jgi:hypothetical protein